MSTINSIVAMPAGGEPLTMSSLEIAELTGKRHDNVLRDIANMLETLGDGTGLSFEGSYKDSTGRTLRCFNLPKRECLILVSGYDVVMRAKIIDRWMHLEEQGRSPRLVVDPSDPKVMLAVFDHLQKQVAEKDAIIAGQSEKVQQLDRIATADGSLCITDAAKALQVRPKELFRYLRAHGWIFDRAGSPVGYQTHVANGDLEHKVTTVLRADGSEKAATQVRVTPQGLVKLSKLVPSGPRLI